MEEGEVERLEKEVEGASKSPSPEVFLCKRKKR